MKGRKNKQIENQAKEIQRLEEELKEEKIKYATLEEEYINYKNKVHNEQK